MPFHPAPNRPLTSPFGPRINPITGLPRHHNGDDFGGTFDVLYYDDGVVISANFTGDKTFGWGHRVVVQHGPNLRTLYAHGREAAPVKVGDRVRGGSKVFTSGTTGASTGVHLHFETHVLQRGLYWAPVNPAGFFAAFAGGTSTPITPTSNQEEDEMKIIAPFGGDARAVIGPGIGHAFGDRGSYLHFCNVWGLNPETPQVVGDAGFGKDNALALFHQIVAMHTPPAAPGQLSAAAVTAAVTAALAGASIPATVDTAAIVRAVEASLADDFARVNANVDQIPLSFTITAK